MAHSGVPDSLPAWRHLNFRSLSALQPRAPPAGVQPLSAVSRRGKVRYTLLPPRAKASHVDAVLPRYVAWLGSDQLGRLATELVLQRHSVDTVKTYDTGTRRYLEYAAEVGLSPLEATQADILRYISWLALQGTVQAKSIGTYLTALNNYFKDHNVQPVALGPLISDALRALATRQLDMDKGDVRILFPAGVALQIYHHAVELLRHGSLAAMQQLRNACATFFSYFFFNRSGTTRAVRTTDVSSDGQTLIFFERHAKGQDHKSVDELPKFFVSHPQFAALMQGYAALRVRFCQTLGVPVPPIYFALPGDQPHLWSAATQTNWLVQAYQQVGASPPDGFVWSSHSLRYGAAAGARAEAWDFEQICQYGGWAIGSTTLQTVYLRVSVRPCPGTHFFFSWLKTRAARPSGVPLAQPASALL